MKLTLSASLSELPLIPLLIPSLAGPVQALQEHMLSAEMTGSVRVRNPDGEPGLAEYELTLTEA